jgi:adenylate kinase
MRVVFLGPPGAGKGTQAERLAAALGVPRVATGDIFRQAVREGTPLGRQAKEYMDRGALVPDDVTVGIVRERLAQPDCAAGFVLDGFPRTLPQAEALDRILGELGRPVQHAVLLTVPDEEIVRRAAGRRVCPRCGATYHLVSSPPRVDERCDACGEALVLRDDDREETVRSRLEVYRRQTEPLAAYYRQRGLLRPVDGTGPIDAVEAAGWRALDAASAAGRG